MRKANAAERAEHARNGGMYPLAYVHGALKIEDLRGSWSRPDPVWEVLAPDGYHFFPEVCHSMLCVNLSEVRDVLGDYELRPCDDNC